MTNSSKPKQTITQPPSPCSNDHSSSTNGVVDNSSTTTHPRVYHERQSRMLCALHALNNVLQARVFSKSALDKIADSLSPNTIVFNPHRNIFGLGNYDANVLVLALQQCGLDIVWCDKRQSLKDHNLVLSNIHGFILNTLSQRNMLGMDLPFAGSHWIAIRRIGDVFYNLDSKFKKPLVIANSRDELLDYLEKRLRETPETQLLFVVSSQVLHDRSWTCQK